MQNSRELLLVYNADSGFFNIVEDGLHKILSPSTYQCNLCTLTHGTLRMKSEWRTFIEKLEIPSRFIHRDEFLRMLESHPHKIEGIKFPAVFLRIEEGISLLISSDEIHKCKTLKDLMNLIANRLSSVEA